MSKHAVYCSVASRGRADQILRQLQAAGFDATAVSVLLLNRPAQDSPNGMQPAVSADLPPAIAWLQGAHEVAIPGVGQLLTGGPVASAFVRTSSQGIADRLITFGVPKAEAERYGEDIVTGEVLLAVHADNAELIAEARARFAEGGAEKIFRFTEIARSKEERFGEQSAARYQSAWDRSRSGKLSFVRA